MHENLQQSRLRILVVDDNEDGATTLSMALELAGHRTGTAYNGRDAVDAAALVRYDAVLLDLHMPVMDGFQAARALRQLQPAPKLIACSAWDNAEARERTSAVGFCAHLGKPVPLNLLEATLERLCCAGTSHASDALALPPGEPASEASSKATGGDRGSGTDSSPRPIGS